MKGIKRSGTSRGKILGHRFGPEGSELLGYLDARKRIYLPCYRWVLENKMKAQLDELRRLSRDHDVVLLDYETNGDVENLSKPLSHASLIAKWIRNEW